MEVLVQWFTDNLSQHISRELIIFIISMIPILELRGGLLAASLLKVSAAKAIPICIIGNIIPIPFILLFIRQIFKVLKKTKLFHGLIVKMEDRAMGKSDQIKRYEFFGLLLFVGIPLPGTALTLGLEPIRPDLLKHKPTRRNENIISKKMLLRIFVNGIFISVIFMLQHFKNFLGAAPEEEATVLFTLFVLFQLFNAFNCRELDDTPMFKNLLKNKLMLGVFLLVLILQGIITQFGAAVFETVPLSAAMWGKMLLTAFTVIILNEGIKAVKRLFVRK